MQLLVNIDVPDLDQGVAFYTSAFDLREKRRLGSDAAELEGAGIQVFLLANREGSRATGSGSTRRYERHWTPLHCDYLVEDLDAAVARAESAGAKVEKPAATYDWGRIAVLADPFGHGFCLIELSEKGYDALPWREAR